MQRVVPALPVRSLDAACDYYVERLGFELDWVWREAPSAPGFAQISKAGLSLYLEEAAREGAALPGSGRVHLYVGDVDRWYEELAEAGAQPEAPRDRPWGNREVALEDPDGNRLMLATVIVTPSAGTGTRVG